MVNPPLPHISTFSEEQSPEVRDRIFEDFNSLAVVYRLPAASFAKVRPRLSCGLHAWGLEAGLSLSCGVHHWGLDAGVSLSCGLQDWGLDAGLSLSCGLPHWGLDAGISLSCGFMTGV